MSFETSKEMEALKITTMMSSDIPLDDKITIHVPPTEVPTSSSTQSEQQQQQQQLQNPARASSPSPSSWVHQNFTLPVEGGVVEGVKSVLLDSDHESESEVFKVMTVKEFPDVTEGEIVLSNEEEEEENDDFTVHFAHHGRKNQKPDMASGTPNLLQQINELQGAVIEMKGSLTDAVSRLGCVVEDATIGERVTETQQKCESNSSEILKLVLTLRTDFSSLKKEIVSIVDRQNALHKSVNILMEDRRSIASDLSQAGVISQHTRARLECVAGVVAAVGAGPGPGPGSGSGSHSNDSGVALLLEKAHNAFAEDSEVHQLSIDHRTSDQDSLPEQPSLLVPSSVYDYVAGLSQPHYSLTSTNSSNRISIASATQNPDHSGCNLTVKDASESRFDSEDLGLVYDSDSSLTIAANKTISLSACLSHEMRVQDSPSDQSRRRRIDSDGSDHSRDRAAAQQPRRSRKPLLGISSTGMYQPTHHVHSNKDTTTSHHHRHRHHRKSDPREAQRYKVARELLDTEKKYCKTLWTIQDVFADPLKKAGILSNKDLTTLFPEEVFLLYDKHCLLQHQLKERLASWKWHPLIGDILSRFTDPRHCEILRLYTTYVNDFPEVLKTFHKLCRTSSTFTKFIKGCLDQPACGGLDLGAFLLTPVQRVPRYILLMKQLLKYTEPSHPDYKHINACLERLRDFLARLNDAMEHSFRLVHTSLSPSMSIAPSAPSYSCVPSGRRSDSSLGSPTLYSMRESPQQYPDQSSPQRSLSDASASASATQNGRNLHSRTGRSSSLPRTSLSSTDSASPGESSAEGQDISPSRLRSRSESVGRFLLSSHPSQEILASASGQPPQKLSAARSVTSVLEAAGNDGASHRWEELAAASEPSLLENGQGTGSMNAAHSVHSLAHSMAGTHKLVTWRTDSISSSEDNRAKKKSSIKTSIKNMFNFKKSNRHLTRSDREEQIYWTPAQSISDGVEGADAPPHHKFVPALSPAIGDFLDEEGNPCSNV